MTKNEISSNATSIPEELTELKALNTDTVIEKATKPMTSLDEKNASPEEIEKALEETKKNLLHIIGEENPLPSVTPSSDPLERSLERNAEMQELLTLARKKLEKEEQ